MRLWSEYEGTTIAGVYPIEKLLRPEGRSAFFSTSNGTGTPAVIRLIESINDEGEILNRWQTVANLQEAHLITLKKFGQTIFDGTPLIYVLMESTEADLAGILKERPLSIDETHQIATSLVGALQALHASDIVHEHVEASNVLATGDIVKLRSDCVREAPEGEEGAALKKRDVHDLAVVLLQALTQRRVLDAAGKAPLPHPYEQIIRNGISGTWGLAQIAAALKPVAPRAALVPAAPATPPATAVPAVAKMQAAQIPLAIPSATPASSTSSAPGPTSAQRVSSTPAAKLPPAANLPVAPQDPVDRQKASVSPHDSAPLSHRGRINVPVEADPAPRRLWIAIAPVVLVILIALGWHMFHKPAAPRTFAGPVSTAPDAVPANSPAPAAESATPPIVQSTPPVASAPRPDTARRQLASTGDADHRWHVVAFTYNHQDQAQHKADDLARAHASLRPEVFSPSGRSPYLVTLGGAMTRNEAIALRAKSRAAGMPRDTFARNYKNAR